MSVKGNTTCRWGCASCQLSLVRRSFRGKKIKSVPDSRSSVWRRRQTSVGKNRNLLLLSNSTRFILFLNKSSESKPLFQYFLKLFRFLSVDSHYLQSSIKKKHGKCVLSLFCALWKEKLCKVPRIPPVKLQLGLSLCNEVWLDSWKVIPFSSHCDIRSETMPITNSSIKWLACSPKLFFPLYI